LWEKARVVKNMYRGGKLESREKVQKKGRKESHGISEGRPWLFRSYVWLRRL